MSASHCWYYGYKAYDIYVPQSSSSSIIPADIWLNSLDFSCHLTSSSMIQAAIRLTAAWFQLPDDIIASSMQLSFDLAASWFQLPRVRWSSRSCQTTCSARSGSLAMSTRMVSNRQIYIYLDLQSFFTFLQPKYFY